MKECFTVFCFRQKTIRIKRERRILYASSRLAVHKSDVYAVLMALEDAITDALKVGEIVRLGNLGTLQIGIAVTEKDYSDSLIKKARINFRPGPAIMGVLDNLTFAKVKPHSTKADKEAKSSGKLDS